ncbi:MAG: GNAT family N-acetyltransferase [Anaerolineae bacterium]|nr:GNAT family N-acetyltransferase [Anaerolineae bacterium]
MELSTAHLNLREFRENDWPAILAYQQDPRYLQYYAWTERTAADVQAFVQMFLDFQIAQPRTKFQLAIVLKETGQLIGNCGLRLKSADAFEADIGYELSPKYWGKGYATEAAQAMVNLGFTQFGLHRITTHCLAENIGSARVLEKVGMQFEGRLRENEFFKGRYWDTLLYATLEREWREWGDGKNGR